MALTNSLRTPVKKTGHPGESKIQSYLSQLVIRDSLSCSDCIKINIYFRNFPVLDHTHSELERRFSNSNLDLMRSVDACNPLSPNFLDSYLLSLLASLYNICTEQLPTECLLAKTVLKDKDTETLFDPYTHFLPLQAPFPTINKLMHVALTLLVSMAQCERSFSTFR